MAKTKTPFFSLGAQGSVGESITAQKRHQSTMVRTKPFPTDPYSLPQAYQRWLYQDYAYLWTQQTETIKRSYTATGAKYHLTGQQYWLKKMLLTLPDIVAMWRLDDNTGATTIDSSKNNNPFTVFGASPLSDTPLFKGFSFDGLNDRLTSLNGALNISSANSFEVVVQILENPGIAPLFRPILSKRNTGYQGLNWDIGGYVIGITFIPNLATHQANFAIAPSTNWLHLIGTWDGLRARLYINGVLKTTGPLGGTWVHQTNPYTMGDAVVGGRPLKMTCCHAVVYNRTLNAAEILKHSLRRYP